MKQLITIVLLLISLSSLSQTNLYWKTGQSAGLDFKSGTATVNPFDTCKAQMTLSNTSVCDDNGNLIFYSDAMFVYDRLDRKMPNGTNFNHSTFGDSYINAGYYPLTQGAIVIPFPNDTNKFYLFYEDMEWNIDGLYVPSKLRYLVVDKTLNGGFGDVTVKDQIVIQNDTLACGQLLATKHGNGKDYWLIVRKYRSDVFYKILISSTGVQTPVIQHIGYAYPFTFVYHGIASINKTGDKLAYPTASFQTSPINDSQLDLFDFDRCTGDLKNYWTKQYTYLPDSLQFASVCFSPNGRFLYVSELDKIYQLDLNAINIWGSLLFIDKRLPANSSYYQMMLGADDKIYCSPYSSYHYLHVINAPNNLGLSCNAVQNQIFFGNGWHYANGGLPNVPNFKLGGVAPCGNVGVEELTENSEQLKVMPNPVSNVLICSCANMLINTIHIYDVLGRECIIPPSKGGQGGFSIDVSKLTSGIYFIKVIDSKGLQHSAKFIKE